MCLLIPLNSTQQVLKTHTKEVLYEKYRTEKLLARRASRQISDEDRERLLQGASNTSMHHSSIESLLTTRTPVQILDCDPLIFFLHFSIWNPVYDYVCLTHTLISISSFFSPPSHLGPCIPIYIIYFLDHLLTLLVILTLLAILLPNVLLPSSGNLKILSSSFYALPPRSLRLGVHYTLFNPFITTLSFRVMCVRVKIINK